MQTEFRIGHGYDVHRFGEGDHIILGGVRIAHDRGLLAHSDGDVLVHAVCDALLGSIAAGDLGQHYPDNDPQYKDIDSCVLLRDVNEKLVQAGYQISNLDITVITEAPTLSPHVASICERLSDVLKITVNQINVKATTTEKLGYIGKKEGLSCHCVVIVYKS